MTRSKTKASTIRDVAREAGVSVATVSRYINGTAPVSGEVALRLDDVMASLRFVPSASARKLARLKTETLGLLLTDIHGDFFAPMMSGIESVTREAGYDLLISSSGRPQPRSAFSLPLGPHNTDGVLVFANSVDRAALEHYAEIGFPVVLIHQTAPEGLNLPCVTVENKSASRLLVEHLIEKHNRRRIAFLKGPDDQEDSHWRELGYRQALEINGITQDERLIVPGEFDRRVARRSVLDLIATGPQFDAVFAGDDESAVGVLEALHESGINVPEDVSVVGFDDQRLSAYLNPALTTVRAPTEEVGRAAARQLLRLVEENSAEPLTLLPTEIVIRRSCGCGGES